tara:strand:- start:123 stop:470 length:348 start_codon:yes stop_codon:yes gene_type:complete
MMNEVINVIKLSACISAQDGVISNRELDTCLELVSDAFKGVTKDVFDQAIDDFFDENMDLEDYLEKINSNTVDKFTVLKICYESAISDGFDIRENLAFTKACKFFDLQEKDFIDA